MLFNSLAFLTLLLASSGAARIKILAGGLLLGSSGIFYYFAGLFDASIFMLSLAINWSIVLLRLPTKPRIIVAIVFNLGLLAFFKYLNFFSGFGDGEETSSYIDIALPLGISFYTFQIMSYHIDVARGHGKEATGLPVFALFISFFPQLIAGPIVRLQQLLPQIERIFNGQRRRVRLFSFGIALFTLGLVKKVVFADSIGPLVDEIFLYGPESVAWAWLGATLFAFQIYLDFSGYSDMAIGSAFLLGIKLPVNFKTPYLSLGPREFWQRWHITLSTWIRDYLYIPLGGSKGNLARTSVLVVITMAIAGLWHGAEMTFIYWGALWGFYIFLARQFDLTLPAPLSIAGNFVITVLLWVPFRAPTGSLAIDYYAVMFGLKEGTLNQASFFAERELFPIAVFLCCLMYGLHILENRLHHKNTLLFLRKFQGPALYGFFASVGFALILLQNQTANPFIYFRF
jgi:alginate O-acetyltransferase complex protein AlgI